VSDWIHVKAELGAVPEDWSLFADAFERFGCPSSIQEDTPPSIGGYLVALDAAEDQVKGLRQALLALGAVAVSSELVPHEDWSELWKQHFKPRRVGRRIVVRPTWEDFDAHPDDLVIVLDPGQAFGTGDHPTTRLCLELLEETELARKAVADLGCGSGILSIAAMKLGAESVDAVDIDPLSVESTRANAALNEVHVHVAAGDGLHIFERTEWDLVVSNIISATLIRMSGSIADAVAEGGTWIASGIIRGNWNEVLSAAERAGFRLDKLAEEDEWVAARFLR
jgi:ribosomal protein L11 methyltransferase